MSMMTANETLAESQEVVLSAPMRGAVERQLEQLKEKLLSPVLEKIGNVALLKEISWAANEAAALAWLTVCPILLLPVLLEEKVRTTLRKWERQQQVLQR